MLKRVFGTETEYSLSMPSWINSNAYDLIKSTPNSVNDFLLNGSRFYLDNGSHPEYATPECSTLKELISHEKAGEWIVLQRKKEQEEILKRKFNNEKVKFLILKNNTDFVSNSWGAHENYLASRLVDISRLADILLPFLVSRLIIVGNGHIWEGKYYFSQRSLFISDTFSSGTTGDKPLFNTRDESHADPERFRRIHLICGDSNMSETSIYLKIGVTALIIQTAEAEALRYLEIFNDIPVLEDPIKSLSVLNKGANIKTLLRLANSKTITALAIQRYYLKKVKNYYQNYQNDDKEAFEIIQKWQEVLDKLEENPMLLNQELDWVIKKNLIEDCHSHLSDKKVLTLNHYYHNIYPKGSMFYLCQNKGLIKRIVDDADIKMAMEQPPQTTRAKLRSLAISHALEKDLFTNVNWNWVKILNDSFNLPDPLKTDPSQIFQESSYFSLPRRSLAEILKLK